MSRPMAAPGDICPLWRKDVSKVCHKCPWYTLVRGQHPQRDEQIDQWGCAIAFGPMLAINTAREARHGATATESFRNEFVSLALATQERPALENK